MFFGVMHDETHPSQGIYATGIAHVIEPMGGVYFILHHAKNHVLWFYPFSGVVYSKMHHPSQSVKLLLFSWKKDKLCY